MLHPALIQKHSSKLSSSDQGVNTAAGVLQLTVGLLWTKTDTCVCLVRPSLDAFQSLPPSPGYARRVQGSKMPDQMQCQSMSSQAACLLNLDSLSLAAAGVAAQRVLVQSSSSMWIWWQLCNSLDMLQQQRFQHTRLPADKQQHLDLVAANARLAALWKPKLLQEHREQWFTEQTQHMKRLVCFGGVSYLAGNMWLTVVWLGNCQAQCTKDCNTFELPHGLTFQRKGMALA